MQMRQGAQDNCTCLPSEWSPPRPQPRRGDIENPMPPIAHDGHAQEPGICILERGPEASGQMEKFNLWAWARSATHVSEGRLPTFLPGAVAFLPEP